MSPRGRVVTPDRRCLAPDCQSSRTATGAYCARHIGIAQRAAQGLIANRRCTAHPSEDALTCRACEAIAEDRIQAPEPDLDPYTGTEEN